MRNVPGYKKAKLLLLAALAIGFVAACTSSPELLPTPTDETTAKWNAAVKKHVHDPQRASKMLQYGQQLFDLQKSLARDIAALDAQGFALNANYTTTREDARHMVADFVKKRDATLVQYRDLIFAMRREVTPAEWKALND